MKKRNKNMKISRYNKILLIACIFNSITSCTKFTNLISRNEIIRSEMERMNQNLLTAGEIVQIHGNIGINLLHHAAQIGDLSVFHQFDSLFQGTYDLYLEDLLIEDDDGKTVLVHAIENNNLEVVKYLVQGFPELLLANPDNLDTGQTLLMLALKHKFVEFDFLYTSTRDIDFNSKDKDGLNLILYACRHDNKSLSHLVPSSNNRDEEVTIIEEIISNSSPDTADYCGRTSLMYAVEDNNFNFIKILLRYANPEVRDVLGKNALDYATNERVFNLLLPFYSLDSSITFKEYKEINSNKLFHLAVKEGNVDRVKELLPKSNTNIKDDNGNIPLNIAMEESNIEITKMLIPYSYVNTFNHYGQNSLHIAILSGSLEIFHLIYPITKYKDKDFQGNNLLLLAAKAGNSDIFEELLPKYDILSLNNDRTSILIYAAQNGNVDIAKKYLSKAQRDHVRLKDSSDRDAFSYAIEHEDLQLAELLLPYFTINDVKESIRYIKSNDITFFDKIHRHYGRRLKLSVSRVKNLLVRAIEKDCTDLFKYILDNNSFLIDDNIGNLCILATKHKRVDILQYLIVHCSDMNYEEDGKTALMVAAENGDWDIFSMLVNCGADTLAERGLLSAIIGNNQKIIEHYQQLQLNLRRRYAKKAILSAAKTHNMTLLRWVYKQYGKIALPTEFLQTVAVTTNNAQFIEEIFAGQYVSFERPLTQLETIIYKNKMEFYKLIGIFYRSDDHIFNLLKAASSDLNTFQIVLSYLDRNKVSKNTILDLIKYNANNRDILALLIQYKVDNTELFHLSIEQGYEELFRLSIEQGYEELFDLIIPNIEVDSVAISDMLTVESFRLFNRLVEIPSFNSCSVRLKAILNIIDSYSAEEFEYKHSYLILSFIATRDFILNGILNSGLLWNIVVHHDSPMFFDILFKYRLFSPKYTDRHGRTFIINAVIQNPSNIQNILRVLYKYNIDVDQKDVYGRKAIDYARGSRRVRRALNRIYPQTLVKDNIRLFL